MAGSDRVCSVNNVFVMWDVPNDVATAGLTVWDRIKIFHSNDENTGYTELLEMAADDGTGNFVTSWEDPAVTVAAKEYNFYLIRFVDSTTPAETKYLQTTIAPTVRELRWIEDLRAYLSPFIADKLSDDDILEGFRLAINGFNIIPPVTGFTSQNFPKPYEPLLYVGAQVYSLMFRYLSVSITDFGYSDQGLSLNIDRGDKVKQATQQLLDFYKDQVHLVKMEFAFTGAGLGTLQLPISIGSNLNRGLLNVLDVFNSMGR